MDEATSNEHRTRRMGRRQQLRLFPWNGLNLKGNLKLEYNSIIAQWRLTPDEKEDKAPTVVDRVKWTIIKHNLQDVHRKLRRLQRPMDQRYFHAARGTFEPIEQLFEKFCDIWTNYLHLDDQIIDDEDEQWINLWISMGELKSSIYDLNVDSDILDV